MAAGDVIAHWPTLSLKYLAATGTQARWHAKMQHLNLQKQQKHLPTQLGKGRDPQDPPRPRIRKRRPWHAPISEGFVF
eukprot:6184701-Pleurochrysis_carterae.AAC.5